MKQKYYRLDNIKKTDAQYRILLGERSNGKSYAVKEEVITRAWKDNEKFVYLRRWDLEIKQSLVEQYFLDCPISSITGDECDTISVYRGEIYLAKYDDAGIKKTKIKLVGYCRALSMESHYSSGAYPDVFNIIFEEFISRDYYLPKEVFKLMNFVSTVARRRQINVYMVGNTISRLCPYFSEWQLVNIPKQQQGTIDIYNYLTDQQNEDGTRVEIKIAVEFCKNSGNNSKMFFGTSTKMITSGTWQTQEVPHLKGNKLLDYYLMYEIFICVDNFKFKCELLSKKDNGVLVWFISPKTTQIKDTDRVITDDIFKCENGMLTTIGLIPLSQQENQVFNLLKNKQIVYSDNLTGSDFDVCFKKLVNNN